MPARIDEPQVIDGIRDKIEFAKNLRDREAVLLTERQLRRYLHHTMTALHEAIESLIEHHNANRDLMAPIQAAPPRT